MVVLKYYFCVFSTFSWKYKTAAHPKNPYYKHLACSLFCKLEACSTIADLQRFANPYRCFSIYHL